LRDYLKMDMPVGEARGVSAPGLAYVGDAVYELMTRTRLCAEGGVTARNMHEKAVARVSAKAQASAARRVLPELTEDERAVYKRGRNTRARSMARGAARSEYHMSTGLEALFGYLYLLGETARLGELFDLAYGAEPYLQSGD
jgi:ribonuclease-3 family protein